MLVGPREVAVRVLSGATSAYDVVADEYEARATVHRGNTQFWVDRLDPYVSPGASVLDVGCGVGLAVAVLASKGFRPAGIDASAEMVRYARARNPNHQIYHADIFQTQLPGKYDALWLEAFIHLFPSTMTNALFDRLLALLKPNGIVTLSTTVADKPSEGWTRKSDYALAPTRFRRRWTRKELTSILDANKLIVVDQWDRIDPFGKEWMIYIVQYNNTD
jgi:2-polyprenyl-3-methyl-5-hydroxy-6-metoxy-1,4-benzoquinol methylase